MEIEIEIDDGVVYIAEECSSGCKYEYKNKQDIIDAIADYINNHLEI